MRDQGLCLLITDHHGINLPLHFATHYNKRGNWRGISPEDMATLAAGPDHEHYWETWDDVLKNATYVESGGIYRLYQDGNLWSYCEEYLTPEERKFLGFDQEVAHDPA